MKVKIDELRNESFEIIPEKNSEDFETTFTKMEEIIDTLEVSLLKLNTLNCSPEIHVTTEVIDAKIKLSTISLLKFPEQYAEWLPFTSQFVTLIEKNKQLSDSQKFSSLPNGQCETVANFDDSYTSMKYTS
ncbi:uncharacterized protein CEXT_603701 [Caerostris extrusa]|uniref:Uncharacterized protein n=1 Tax=Caerostris extrusa TaxID=172846 RepID=A0AAV4NVV4_CAEEX|nr:uncharacterized protein CEXT_603701 [Caerostris extrusa]